MALVIDAIAADSLIERLRRSLDGAPGVVHVAGLWGSSAPMLVSLVGTDLSRTFLYVTSHLEEADGVRDDLELFSGNPCDLLPAWEALAGEGSASGEIDAERLRLCANLHAASSNVDGQRRHAALIAAPIQALMQPVPTKAALQSNTLHIAPGRSFNLDPLAFRSGSKRTLPPSGPEALLAWAIDRGFERLELVESPGDVAKRGDILDLFVPGEEHPYRVHFFGDEIESIHRFEVGTQRSIATLDNLIATVLPTRQSTPTGPTTDFFDYLPTDTVVILESPSEIQSMGETLQTRIGESDRLIPVCDILARAADFTQFHLSSFAAVSTSNEESFDIGVTSVSRYEGTAAESVANLCQSAVEKKLHVVCDNEGERRRLTEMITEQDPAAAGSIQLHIGVMQRGFEWTRTNTVVLAHHEIFHRHRQRRRIRRMHAARPLETWLDLKPGDSVVHVLHGIAVYCGLKKMRKGAAQQEEEFLTLEFAEKATVYVPCSQIDLVQKYIGSGGRRPKLSTIGGKRWNKSKEKVAEAISELAETLLRVQALRNEAEGTAYPADTVWQREFEAAFPYEETEDQLLVAADIRDDLMRYRPADRLVCGDVGYGKTELAMRAAFKVVEYGRQVAVLVPTTVLAEQHYETFQQRMAEFPFSIACLSRFRTGAEQKKIVERLKRGQLDIVIGTHRLVSKDVSFANLGLVIIDEEQRFGVEHKERLKAMRATVDVLTLTATPIPRTLHMALMGIRDISSLQTPPVDRRSIVTRVGPFNRDLVRNAILREMNRDGQVYFVHNLVHSIAAMVDTVRTIVPEARVVFAHGQMRDTELETAIMKFVRREADVLVTTTIIESGVDIPSVNTIFINKAERFGLADLHQLRGRVGRSDRRAYCYLMLSPDRPPTAKATKRLKTIEEFSELGAGFRIAMRDLEIRGAGNLLGAEQSGHIAVVGYEMYCRLLEQTVRRLRKEPDPHPPAVQVDLDVTAHIPRHYIAAERSRIEIYRRIVGCSSEADLVQLEKDLVDAFGSAPPEVDRLLQVAELRVRARSFGIKSIILQKPDVVFSVERPSVVEPLFADAPGSVRVPDPHTIHLRLPENYLETDTLLPVLRRMFTRAVSRVEAKT